MKHRTRRTSNDRNLIYEITLDNAFETWQFVNKSPALNSGIIEKQQDYRVKEVPFLSTHMSNYQILTYLFTHTHTRVKLWLIFLFGKSGCFTHRNFTIWITAGLQLERHTNHRSRHASNGRSKYNTRLSAC